MSYILSPPSHSTIFTPVQQIMPTSYLGQALKQIGKHTKKQSLLESDSSSVTETSSDDSDSESDPSNSSSSSSLSETTTSSDESSEKGRHNRWHGHKLSSKKKHGKKSRCMYEALKAHVWIWKAETDPIMEQSIPALFIDL